LALSTDGKTLCTHGRGDPVRLWDWATGREAGKRAVPGGATHGTFAGEDRFAFADGDEVTVCGADGEKKTIATGRARLIALAASPDGTLLATRCGSGREVGLWDTATRKERHTLGGTGDDSKVRHGVLAETAGVVPPDLVFSPDGQYLAGAGPGRQ